MNVTVYPAHLSGRVECPPSKSCAHRLLLAAALAPGETRILNAGENRDVEATVSCLRALGARISGDGRSMTIRGGLDMERSASLNCLESGSTLRFFLPLCALRRGETRITGEGRLPQRPNGDILSALRENGARISGETLPLVLSGGLRSGVFSLPGNVSSQFFTGLLFALPCLTGDSRVICVGRLESRPYVDLTRDILKEFGVDSQEAEDGYLVPGGQTYVSPGEVRAEGDWSSGAFWLGANWLGAEAEVTGLKEDSRQADRAARSVFSRVGGEIDVSAFPDLMPILSAVAACAEGRQTRITGGARLRLKESDRIAAMKNAICAMGGWAEEREDGLWIRGCRLSGGTVDAVGDHRVAMSAAVAACFARGETRILGAECAAKSYPNFFRDLQTLGGKCCEYAG